MIDLEMLNTLTKYPSIPTYHALGERGRLTHTVTRPLFGDVLVTEKIDGTNARIVVLPGGDYLIGGREEWLHASGDRVWRNDNNIVEVLRPYAERAAGQGPCVIYGEVYGGKINGWKAYAQNHAGASSYGFRVFDVVDLAASMRATTVMTREQVSAWRDGGGVRWETWGTVHITAEQIGAETVPTIEASPPPLGLTDTLEWLRSVVDETDAALTGATPGRAEGVVIRGEGNQIRVKLRFDDYERGLR